MHVFEAALVASTTDAAASHIQAMAELSPNPARLLPRALAGLAVIVALVAFLDGTAAQRPMLADTSDATLHIDSE